MILNGVGSIYGKRTPGTHSSLVVSPVIFFVGVCLNVVLGDLSGDKTIFYILTMSGVVLAVFMNFWGRKYVLGNTKLMVNFQSLVKLYFICLTVYFVSLILFSLVLIYLFL